MTALAHRRRLNAALPSPDQAVARFFESRDWSPIDVESISLDGAYGRILAEDFLSPHPLPTRPRAEIDGYALRSTDLTAGDKLLRCSLEARKGKLAIQSVRRGEAVRVTAGAVLPPGCNAVVPVEATVLTKDQLRIIGSMTAGDHVVQIGAHVAAMQTLVSAGFALRGLDLARLAAFGVDCVRVFRRPAVALITFDDDIAAPGRLATPWQHYDVNRYLVGAVLSSWGARVLPFRATLGGTRTLASTMTMALRHSDAVVLAGGTDSAQRNSAAVAIDLLQPGGVVIEGVRMMPSAGLVLGSVGNCPVLSVPGDPTAALSGLLAVGEPIVRRLVGRAEKSPARQYTLEQAIRGKRGWDCFIAVRTRNGACSPIETASNYISTVARADGFVRIPAHVGHYRAGEPVDVERLP